MPYQTEALSWLLGNKNRAALAENYFKTTANAIEAVKRLYAAGATRVDVFVQHDEPWRVNKEGGEYADTLLVFGSPKQKELFNVIRSLKPDNWEPDTYELEPGEPPWTLWWD